MNFDALSFITFQYAKNNFIYEQPIDFNLNYNKATNFKRPH